MPTGRRSYEAVQGGSALYTGGRVVSGREVRNGVVHRFLVAPCGAHCTVLAVNASWGDEVVGNASVMEWRKTSSTTAAGASCPAVPLAILASDEDADVEEEEEEEQQQRVTSVCVSPDGRLVFYATRSGRGYLFAEWYPLRSAAAHPDEAVDAATAVAESPDRPPRTRPCWAFLPFESSRRVVIDCCFDASSTLLACASATGDVRVFDARQRYVTHVIRPAGVPGIATCVVFRQGDAVMREADGRQQSSSSPTSRRARHRRDARRPAAATAEADTSSTTSAAHPERSLQLWVGFESGAIAQYDLQRKRWCGQTQHHDGAVLCMVAIPDDTDDDLHSAASRLVSAGMDALLIVWDTQRLRPLHTVLADAPLTCVASLNWLPNGAYRLAVGTAGGTMQVVEMVSDDAPRIHHTGVQVSSGAAAVIEVGRPGERKLPAAVDSEAIAVVSVAPLESAGAAENLVVMATADQMLHIVRVAGVAPDAPSSPRLEVIHTLVGNLDQVYDIQCVDGCATADHWDVAVAGNLHAIPVFRLETARRPRSALSSLSASSSFLVCHRNLVGHTDAVLALAQVPPAAPSPADTSATTPAAVHLASASKDRTVRLWDVGRGVEVVVGTGHTAAVQAVCCNWGRLHSPSSQPALVVVSGDDDGTLKWWTRSTERAVRTKSAAAVHDARRDAVRPSFPCAVTIGRAHSDEVHALAFAPDAQWVASGSRDRTVKLWRVADVLAAASPTALPTPHAVLAGHRRAVWSVCFSPSEPRLLASASSDRTIRLWSVRDGSCVRMLQSTGGRSREAGSLLRCLFIAGGGGGGGGSAQVVSASSNGSVCVWHAGTGEWVGELVAPPDGEGERANLSVGALETSGRAHDDRVWALTTVPGVSTTDGEEAGAYLLTGGADGRVWLWRDVTAEQVERAAQQRDALLLREQSLQNALQRGRWREALVGALEMDRPARAYAAVEAVIARAADSVEETEPEEVLVAWMAQWSSSSSSITVWRLLQYVCEWNVQARTAAVAQRVLRALFRAYHPPARLRAHLCQAGDDRRGRVHGEQVRALAVVLHAHTQRHATRAQRLWDELRLLDYVVERRSGALGNGDDGLEPGEREASAVNGGRDGEEWPGNGEMR